MNGLTKKLETVVSELGAAISDRDSLMKKYQMAGTEMERMRAELTQTRAE